MCKFRVPARVPCARGGSFSLFFRGNSGNDCGMGEGSEGEGGVLVDLQFKGKPAQLRSNVLANYRNTGGDDGGAKRSLVLLVWFSRETRDARRTNARGAIAVGLR